MVPLANPIILGKDVARQASVDGGGGGIDGVVHRLSGISVYRKRGVNGWAVMWGA